MAHALPPKPTVTEEHRLAAFQAMHWVGWSYEQAMTHDTRSRLVNLRARQLCDAEHRAMQRRVIYPAAANYRHATTHRLDAYDCKRAAAGDRDD